MRKTLTFGVFILSVAIAGSFLGLASAQETEGPQAPDAVLLIEEFSYPTGQLTTVSGGNWITNTGTGNFIPVTEGSLSYPSYPSSGIGNKIQRPLRKTRIDHSLSGRLEQYMHLSSLMLRIQICYR
jgi:hypothetical protein